MAKAMVVLVLGLMMNVVLLLGCIGGSRGSKGGVLREDYYNHTCPNVEDLIFKAVEEATKIDHTVPAGLLRMHFHDCFIRGCDASVLIDSKGKKKAEKDGPPNLSLHGFGVIDNAKTLLEAACPKTVSCADILAIAARDVVVLSGGPHWSVLKGRKDGKISRAKDTRGLPAPIFNTTQLKQSFLQRNLSTLDMVALSGGHTLGFSHCSSFNNRLFNFDSTNEVDPSMDMNFAKSLTQICPKNNSNNAAGASLDSTRKIFDRNYYLNILNGKGVFSSDQSLFLDETTKKIVTMFSQDEKAFFSNFVASMIKMGNIKIKTGKHGEVRLNCRCVNS